MRSVGCAVAHAFALGPHCLHVALYMTLACYANHLVSVCTLECACAGRLVKVWLDVRLRGCAYARDCTPTGES